MAQQTTVERILDAAMNAVARHGHRKLSMRDVCDEAGISRGTLYRYFSNKSAVLEAIGRHVAAGVRAELAAATADQPDPAKRFQVVVETLSGYGGRHPEALQLMEAEPEFTLRFVREVLPQFVDIVADALEPGAQHVAAVREKVLTVRQLGELALRVTASTFFVPMDESQDIADWVGQLGCFAPVPHAS